MEFNFLISLEDELSNKKRVRIYEEDDITLGSIKMADYFQPKADESINLSPDNSAWDSKRSLVPK